MKKLITLGAILAVAGFGLVTQLPGAPKAGNDKSVAKADGSTAKIKWGTHWAGPEVNGPKSLEGKVVLLKIWGG